MRARFGREASAVKQTAAGPPLLGGAEQTIAPVTADARHPEHARWLLTNLLTNGPDLADQASTPTDVGHAQHELSAQPVLG